MTTWSASRSTLSIAAMEAIAANPGGKGPAGERRTPSTRMPNAAARSATAQPRAPAPITAQRSARELEQRLAGRRPPLPPSCARTSAGSWRAKASISPSTCSAMLIAWLPLPLVSTRWSLATSFGVEIRSMPAPRHVADHRSRAPRRGWRRSAGRSRRSPPPRRAPGPSAGHHLELQDLDALQGVAEDLQLAPPRSDGGRRRSRGASDRAAASAQTQGSE